MTRSGSLTDLEGGFNFGSYFINFYWDSASDWYTDVNNVSEGSLEIEFYDPNLDQYVIMTLN